ncbi:MAG TPA: cation:dicarboxylase symporter family transporter, partial [Gemmatimonadales bacterium]|nr:cation:dicarboxylase symporter family transporter [Gemmatimonadales bacterium]
MFAALRKIPLTWWIGISMVVGILIGYLDNAVWTGVSLAPALQPISMIFIKMIKSIVVPLIFGSLVVGIAGHGDDLKQVGRLAFRSIIYFEIATTAALF